jgi:hypothetical protein
MLTLKLVRSVDIQPDGYAPKLDVRSAPLREQDPITAGSGQAA